MSRGPLESGPMEVGDEVAAVIMFETPEAVGDLAMGVAASVRSRYGMPPSLISAALRQLADTIDQQYGAGECVCGEHHG